MVMGIVEELVALRDYRNVLDGRYKQRFDRLAKEIVAVAKVKMTAEMNAKLAYGAGPGVQG
jgi:epoxyqueuosine reductase QueG